MPVSLTQILLTAIFGVVGVLSRYALSLGVARFWAPTLPYATFIINISGSFLIGMLLSADWQRAGMTPELKVALAVGFLGGYTTFSSYSYETYKLILDGRVSAALTYALGSVVLGVAAAAAGSYLVVRYS